MGRGYYAVLRPILLRYGCTFVRQGKGSHEIWHSPITRRCFSVPVTVAAKPTARAILKQAGIDEKI